MARPTPDVPPAAAILALADEKRRFMVRVTPGARQEGIAISDGLLLIKVRANAHDGAANAAVVRLLAQALGVAASRVSILRGATGRMKVVALAE